jgi:hypothetical protein
MTRVYDSPAGDITFEAVSEFVESALSTDLLTESLTLELKRQRSGTNVVDAVAAMANTDGGLVLVGIANEGAFADRFTGMSQSQHLALVDQLRSLLSGQMPEVIPVRIPDSDLLIVVIRIDADQFETPVVVGGRVLVRAPGQSVPADRERVVALSRPSSANAGGPIEGAPASLPMDNRRFDLSEEEGRHLSLRVAAYLELPRRALGAPWLSTAARTALVDSLEASAVPKGVWLGRAPTSQSSRWKIFQARSASVRARALRAEDVGSAARSNCGGGVYLGLAGRELSILLELSFADEDAVHPVTMNLAELFEGLTAVVLAATSTLAAVAEALGCGEPVRLTYMKGWLIPSAGRNLADVVPLAEFGRHGHAGSSNGDFRGVRPESRDAENLVEIVRAWITAMLLDDAVFGFEDELVALPSPSWR